MKKKFGVSHKSISGSDFTSPEAIKALYDNPWAYGGDASTALLPKDMYHIKDKTIDVLLTPFCEKQLAKAKITKDKIVKETQDTLAHFLRTNEINTFIESSCTAVDPRKQINGLHYFHFDDKDRLFFVLFENSTNLKIVCVFHLAHSHKDYLRSKDDTSKFPSYADFSRTKKSLDEYLAGEQAMRGYKLVDTKAIEYLLNSGDEVYR